VAYTSNFGLRLQKNLVCVLLSSSSSQQLQGAGRMSLLYLPLVSPGCMQISS